MGLPYQGTVKTSLSIIHRWHTKLREGKERMGLGLMKRKERMFEMSNS